MAKKIKYFLTIFCFCITLTGCNDVIDLTEEESHLIAEYAADLLLKYDRTYVDRIEDGNYRISREEATSEMMLTEVTTELIDSEELLDTVEPDTEAITTKEEATEAIDTQEKNTDSSSEDDLNQMDNSDGDAEDFDEQVNEYSVVEGDIARIAGLRDASIKYKDYLITKQYPAVDEDGKFIYLEAKKGHDLLVVRFNVTNNTEDMVDVSLIDNEIDYRIVCNGRNAAKPMLTILMDDLGTLETSLREGETQEAVLVFQIADSLKDSIDSLELKVMYEGVDNVIKIK